MNRDIHAFLKVLWQSVVFWTMALLFYAVFRFFGIDHETTVTINSDVSEDFLMRRFIVSGILGTGLGVLYAFVDLLFEKTFSKKMTLGTTLLLKTGLYFIVTVVTITGVVHAVSNILGFEIDIETGWWREDKRFWALLLYIIISSLVFSFLKIAIGRFGRGVFLKMLLGKYKVPQEENRIFMFLDLKSSTTIAEKIGHHKYSRFIQDSFFDLNEVVVDYDAEIYQYVGDEAVISWPYQKGLENNNCIGLFFAFEEKRDARRDYYMSTYGHFPEFKAGLHGGVLMAAEVGFVKKELAYHGDVINTSARIQAECNKYNVTLLLSGKLLQDLSLEVTSKSNLLGNILLKGKNDTVKIHSVTKL